MTALPDIPPDEGDSKAVVVWAVIAVWSAVVFMAGYSLG